MRALQNLSSPLPILSYPILSSPSLSFLLLPHPNHSSLSFNLSFPSLTLPYLFFLDRRLSCVELLCWACCAERKEWEHRDGALVHTFVSLNALPIVGMAALFGDTFRPPTPLPSTSPAKSQPTLLFLRLSERPKEKRWGGNKGPTLQHRGSHHAACLVMPQIG
ncbi:hypothetical protein IE53DRAFT_58033 [Violaceomyces palustris]|uniref:Uncharacterized protein n=1 Tax=Violaceomyces palustris TaxID=1673888 RepID=A0ACD0NZQ0_9BASI|nr:hypothetical protein IE53DRAFT_58033 [Violaceomyces palustris]